MSGSTSAREKKARVLQSFKGFTGPGHPIDTDPSKRLALSSVDGVLYGKPNLFANPKTCMFKPVLGTPANVGLIYSTAAATMSGGQPTDYNFGWTGNRTSLDIILKQWQTTFGSAPKNIAIALNFDDIVNNGSAYYYDFGVEDSSVVDPSQLIIEGEDTTSLKWILGDTFSGGTITQDGITRRKTIVFTCPFVTGGSSYVSFSLAYVESLKGVSNSANPQFFDPKIKNDG